MRTNAACFWRTWNDYACLALGGRQTARWSRYMVTETPPQGRVVWVLTYINGPGGLRPVFLPGIEVAAPR